MNVFLWILQALLAAAMLAAGGGKLAQPYEKTAESMAWARSFSAGQVKTIAALEVVAALGLILPAATGIATVLTPLAAVGVALIMIGAVVTHARRGEWPSVGINIVLLAVAIVIAWGRFGPYAW
ncbi:DoxX family protein [Streptomyces sp. NPDC058155]|uniref:DoxX family protein n=1 Tax=Streptomyces sp. NPDC058155 TaxID=3346359 RepID=UPI0036E6D85B